MRITGGELKGRRLSVPPGRLVRPTQDRVREALFSMLAPCLAGARVLDLFAGSGSVGLEAWSRGAVSVCWVEGNPRVGACLKRNRALCPPDAGTVVLRRVERFLRAPCPGPGYDLIFADPPYGSTGVLAAPGLLSYIGDGQWVAEEGLVVLEQSPSEPRAEAPGWTLADEREYGAARLSFLRQSKERRME